MKRVLSWWPVWLGAALLAVVTYGLLVVQLASAQHRATVGDSNVMVSVFVMDSNNVAGAGCAKGDGNYIKIGMMRSYGAGPVNVPLIPSASLTLGQFPTGDANLGGIMAVDDGNWPGVYRVFLPNQAWAQAGYVSFSLQSRVLQGVGYNITPTEIHFDVTASALRDANFAGLAALGAKWEANYAGIVAVAGKWEANYAGLAALTTRSDPNRATAEGMLTVLQSRAATTEANVRLDIMSRGTSTLTQAQVTGGAYALATNGSGQITVGSLLPVTTWTVDLTGNLSGSVGSVTGGVKIGDPNWLPMQNTVRLIEGEANQTWARVAAMLDANTASRQPTVTFPTNFGVLSISATTGLVDITQTGADKVWGTATRTLTGPTNLTGMTVHIDDPNHYRGYAVLDLVQSEANAAQADGNWIRTTLKIGGIGDANDIRVAANAGSDANTIAGRVLDIGLAQHVGAGSVGQAINAAGAAADPLLNPVPGTYLAGTAGNALGSVVGIKAKTDLITAGGVTVRSPVLPGGDVVIAAGDDYLHADGGALTWTVAAWAGQSMTDANARLRVISDANWQAGATAPELDANAWITINGTTLTLRANLTAAQTAALATSPPSRLEWNYHYQIVAITAGGSAVTVVDGRMLVRKKLR